MVELNNSGSALQLGVNLLSNKGGVYQAVRDYEAALGGSMCSLLDPHEDRSGQIDSINYFPMGSDPMSRLAGRVKHSEHDKLYEQLAQASHLFLHGSYRLTAAYALESCSRSDVEKPLFYIPHGSLDPWVFEKRGWVKRYWVKKFGQSLFERSKTVLAMTHNELKKIQRLAGVRSNQAVVYLPLALEDLPKVADRAATRSKHGLSQDARLLCYLGRLHHMKRPIETIEALALKSDPRLQLVIVGPDDSVCAEELRQYAAKLGLSDRVHVLGPVYGDEKYALLAASDGYISLSHRENFNYTAAEAMGMGLPVILSPGNDLQGELGEQDCGWLLKSLDGSEIAACLSKFLESSEGELSAMGRRGREWVAEHLNQTRFRESLQNLL